MGSIEALQKNKRNCQKCGGGYVINGDPSDVWCELPWIDVPTEGLCEFCRPTGKYFLNNVGVK